MVQLVSVSVSVHVSVSVILFKLKKPLACRLLFKVSRNESVRIRGDRTREHDTSRVKDDRQE